MKEIRKIPKIPMISILIACAFLLFFKAQSYSAAVVRLSNTDITIMKHESIVLKVEGSKKKPKWNSSNKKIAKVNKKGKVTGVKAGTATIKCKVAGKTLSCRVTVKNSANTQTGNGTGNSSSAGAENSAGSITGTESSAGAENSTGTESNAGAENSAGAENNTGAENSAGAGSTGTENSTGAGSSTGTEAGSGTTVTTQKMACPVCDGYGDCKYCKGLGECDHCFGEGTVTCSNCEGSGSCPSCYGTKGEYKYAIGGKKWVKCLRCSGSGNCTRCNGRGDVKCSRCNGSGRCTHCNGNPVCQYCNGTGVVEGTADGTGKTDDNRPGDSTSINNPPNHSAPSGSNSQTVPDHKAETANSANLATVTIDGVETVFYLYSAYVSEANYLCVDFYTLGANGSDKGCRLGFQIKMDKVYAGSSVRETKKSGMDYENSEMGQSIFASGSYASMYQDSKTKRSGNYRITFDSVDGTTYKGSFEGELIHKSCAFRYSYKGEDYKTFENGTFEFTLDEKNQVFQ